MENIKNKHGETWYVCMNCFAEYQLHSYIVEYSDDVECPQCGSQEFSISESYDRYHTTEPSHDYANYDKYDEYY